jgi:ATP-dependent Clp protease ATP-binding subunit ClpC
MKEFKNQYFDLRKTKFFSCLWLDNVFPRKIRHSLSKFFNLISIITLIAVAFTYFEWPVIGNFSALRSKLIFFLFLSLPLGLMAFALESFYRSKSDQSDYLDFESASLLGKTLFERGFLRGANVLETFTGTENGGFFFRHLGIAVEDFRLLLRQIPPPKELSFIAEIEKILQEKEKIGLEDAISAAVNSEEGIAKLFFDLGIKKEHISGALSWTNGVFRKRERARRWWLEENLMRIPGIAKDLSYGATYLLDRFSHPFASHVLTEHRTFRFIGHQKKIEAIEAILSRRGQANVLVVGEPGSGRRTAVAGFYELLRSGRIRPELEYKLLIELDAPALVAAAKTKGELEDLIIRVFNDANRAGNIILLIDNFADFLKSAESLGVFLLPILGPYFESKTLQIVAIVDSNDFKRFIEPDSSLMQYFETVKIEEPDESELIQILEDTALEAEKRKGVVVLYQTISEIVNAAEKYFTEGALPERAIDVLEIVSSRIASMGRVVVLPGDISNFATEKIKMPLSEIRPEEKEKLMHLEDIFHRRIINQQEAISAISTASRRARVGIAESKRPIASFLFLGPTGVGKTETAKALTEIYFGDENLMSRFDMSEYQSEEGLGRLIGSFERNEQGILATTARDKPYGLLLLDEFEKCHQKVLDLFLQILDEGFFTDAFGRKVYLRNRIIIATSNAGSQLIWELGKKGVDPATLKDAIIDEIQKKGIFKPELLNRFDGIIIFHHLNRDHLKAIARLMLQKLRKRLLEKEIDLVINNLLIEKVVDIGYDPVFGARPMQRAIQNRIEKKIAEWMINGKIERGAKIEFSKENLEEV